MMSAKLERDLTTINLDRNVCAVDIPVHRGRHGEIAGEFVASRLRDPVWEAARRHLSRLIDQHLAVDGERRGGEQNRT